MKRVWIILIGMFCCVAVSAQIQDSLLAESPKDSFYFQADSLGQDFILDSLQALIPKDTLYHLYQSYLRSTSKETWIDTANMDGKAIIEWDTLVLDYGIILTDTIVSRTFQFRNIGDAPLQIQKVKTSCGCTVLDYPKEYVLPESSASMEVRYESKNRIGDFEQAIIVYDNTDGRRTILRIKGKVIESIPSP